MCMCGRRVVWVLCTECVLRLCVRVCVYVCVCVCVCVCAYTVYIGSPHFRLTMETPRLDGRSGSLIQSV